MKSNNLNLDINQLDPAFKALSNRNFLIFSLIFFAAIICLAIWGIIPQFNLLFSNQAELKQEEVALFNIDNKLNEIQDISSDPNFAQAKLVNNILYDGNPFLEVLYALNQVATDNSVIFDRFEYSPGLIASASAQFADKKQSAQSVAARNANAKTNQGFTIFIEAKGSYYNIVTFLNELESYAPLNSVAYSDIKNDLAGNAIATIEILAQYYTPNITANLSQALPKLTQADYDTLELLYKFKIPKLDDLNQTNLVGGKTDLFLPGNIQVVVPTEEELNQEVIIPESIP